MVRLIQESGWGAYPLILVGVPLLLASPLPPILGVKVPKAGRIVATLVLAGVCVLALLALLGFGTGFLQVMEAVAHVNPADKQLILRMGIYEAEGCFVIAALFGALPLLCGAAGVLLARRSPQGRSALAMVALVLAAVLGATVAVGAIARTPPTRAAVE